MRNPQYLIVVAVFLGLITLPTKSNAQTVEKFPRSSTSLISSPHDDFIVGHTFMDSYRTGLFKKHLYSTIKSMQQDGANWVIFDNYWSYHDLMVPIIGPFPNRNGFRDASTEEICEMTRRSHERGLKYALMLELNYDVAEGPWVSWEHHQRFWDKSVSFILEKGENIGQSSAWWDKWFFTYGDFLKFHARTAAKCGVDMLIVGKQLGGATKAGNRQRWRKLIEEVRYIYSGTLSYAATVDPGSQEIWEFPFHYLDYIIAYLWLPIINTPHPTREELQIAFETLHVELFSKASKYHQKPVIFLTPFQSRDNGARQVWFEPSNISPNVKQDYKIQASMYDAFLRSTVGKKWIKGMFTWGYWWKMDSTRNDAPDDVSYNKSSSVRGKPAGNMIKKWSDRE